MFGPMMMGPSSYAGMGLLGGGVLPNQNQPNQLLQGLMPQQNNLAGLLGSPVFGAGMNLLAARNDARINPWMAAMQGLQGAQQFRMQNELFKDKRQSTQDEQKYREQMLQLQRERIQQDIARLSAPTSNMRDYEAYKNLTPEQQAVWEQVNGRQANVPAALKEYYALSEMTPEQQALYFRNKRASQIVDMGGGGQGRVNPITDVVNPVVRSEDAIARNVQEAEEVKKAQIRAGTQAEASTKIPAYKLMVDDVKRNVAELKAHPGLESAVGLAGVNPLTRVPGSEPENFRQFLETTKGKQFAVAYETLKGGGTITEVETAAASAALGNLSTAQSVSAFNKAADDFVRAVELGLEKLEATAGVEPSRRPPPDASIDDLVDYYGG